MRKSYEFEFITRPSLNGRHGRKLRIGIPKRDSVPALRIESDLSRRNRAHAMAMDGRRYEDIAWDEDLRVTKPVWDTKRVCRNCANSVYDLGRHPTACPRCGSRFDREAPLTSRPSQPAAAAKPDFKWR